MDENESMEQVEESTQENETREEVTAEETNSSTENIEETSDDNSDEVNRRLSSLEDMMGRVLGGLEALREAQGIMVENGATVIDSEPENLDLEDDSFISPSELDLLI